MLTIEWAGPAAYYVLVDGYRLGVVCSVGSGWIARAMASGPGQRRERPTPERAAGDYWPQYRREIVAAFKADRAPCP